MENNMNKNTYLVCDRTSHEYDFANTLEEAEKSALGFAQYDGGGPKPGEVIITEVISRVAHRHHPRHKHEFFPYIKKVGELPLSQQSVFSAIQSLINLPDLEIDLCEGLNSLTRVKDVEGRWTTDAIEGTDFEISKHLIDRIYHEGGSLEILGNPQVTLWEAALGNILSVSELGLKIEVCFDKAKNFKCVVISGEDVIAASVVNSDKVNPDTLAEAIIKTVQEAFKQEAC